MRDTERQRKRERERDKERVRVRERERERSSSGIQVAGTHQSCMTAPSLFARPTFVSRIWRKEEKTEGEGGGRKRKCPGSAAVEAPNTRASLHARAHTGTHLHS